jgi:hypothetical protein
MSEGNQHQVVDQLGVQCAMLSNEFEEIERLDSERSTEVFFLLRNSIVDFNDETIIKM